MHSLVIYPSEALEIVELEYDHEGCIDYASSDLDWVMESYTVDDLDLVYGLPEKGYDATLLEPPIGEELGPPQHIGDEVFEGDVIAALRCKGGTIEVYRDTTKVATYEINEARTEVKISYLE